MSDENPQCTEQKIKEAARKVFIVKGFDGTTTRDIAEVAGINQALTNYYFRSKEKLFRLIFEDIYREYFQEIFCIMVQPVELRVKIPQLVEAHFSLFDQNPDLPLFLLSEMRRHPNLLTPANYANKERPVFVFLRQLQQAADEGQIRPVAPMHVLQLVMANIQFMYLSRPITMEISSLDEAAHTEFTRRHKDIVIDMLMNYLFIY
ncbi:TetR family transcriptional regulator [Hymenobacter qilianensis]|uniref:TetR family transcriptional regulator n=2 Tax=Hymenobacter qilianensis TaxID=1385715 RepID=A0ACB5PUB6_9BACT|nr:TetR/AcrR family transcriptional regulator [Hymenobacter qilianensis]QNP51692.1 TetR/AcrR family transcriptional regulator [Hymenobacter qilianensis]GGF72800.1 TetR family transcriptional regulator [Hymenobacter qilianensis]